MTEHMPEVTKVQELVYELRIEDVMRRDLITVSPLASMHDLKELLRLRKISGVPVVEEGRLVGIVSLEDLIKALSSTVWGWSEEGVKDEHAAELNLNLSDRRLRLALDLARELIGTPRHLSQHPGGFVLTHDRLDELVPTGIVRDTNDVADAAAFAPADQALAAETGIAADDEANLRPGLTQACDE